MTRKGDDSAWNDFVTWCRKRGLSAMPANPWTVAAYARWCERHHRFPAIMKTIRAIARVHRSKSRRRPERDPTVARTMRMIESRARPKKKGTGLFPEADIVGGSGGGGAAKGAGRKTRDAKAAGTRETRRGGRNAPKRGLSARPKLVSRRNLKK